MGIMSGVLVEVHLNNVKMYLCYYYTIFKANHPSERLNKHPAIQREVTFVWLLHATCVLLHHIEISAGNIDELTLNPFHQNQCSGGEFIPIWSVTHLLPPWNSPYWVFPNSMQSFTRVSPRLVHSSTICAFELTVLLLKLPSLHPGPLWMRLR